MDPCKFTGGRRGPGRRRPALAPGRRGDGGAVADGAGAGGRADREVLVRSVEVRDITALPPELAAI
jgi:hypothetical protein